MTCCIWQGNLVLEFSAHLCHCPKVGMELLQVRGSHAGVYNETERSTPAIFNLTSPANLLVYINNMPLSIGCNCLPVGGLGMDQQRELYPPDEKSELRLETSV